MKLSQLGKSLAAATIVLAVIAGVVANYLLKPLPSPDVSIEFQGYIPGKTKVFDLMASTNEARQFYDRSNGWFSLLPDSHKFSPKETNALFELSLTNHGPTRVWWASVDCLVEAKTPNGWITNCFQHFTIMPDSVGSSGKEEFRVYVPIDAVEWRVSCQYSYYKRHRPAEFIGRAMDDLNLSHKHPAWGLSPVPEPDDGWSNAISEFFTNKPPASIKPPIGD